MHDRAMETRPLGELRDGDIRRRAGAGVTTARKKRWAFVAAAAAAAICWTGLLEMPWMHP